MTNKGFTLIEITISLMILSVVLMSFTNIFGDVVQMTDKGQKITTDTFDLQKVMENAIIDIKKDFVNDSISSDYSIEVFSGLTNYKTDVEVKKVEEKNIQNRRYVTLVSKEEIAKPLVPELISYFFGAYLDIDDAHSNKVFPWYQDDIVLASNYELKDEPEIFSIRKRWYSSNKDIDNPVFKSQYRYDEEVEEDPNITYSSYSEIDKNDTFQKDDGDPETTEKILKPNKFYYFELRPYTFAGRVNFFKNEKRLLVLNKPLSSFLKDFIEEIYFEKDFASGGYKTFKNIDNEVYSEVMQTPSQPTIDLEWNKDEDPEGALIGKDIPNEYIDKDFNCLLEFYVDKDTLNNKPVENKFGYLFGDSDNNGNMITFDIANNKLNIHKVIEGEYESLIKSIDLDTHTAFSEFKNDESAFNWLNKYVLNVEYIYKPVDAESKELPSKILLNLSYEKEDGTIITSDNITFESTIDTIDFIGLKAYSSLDYKVSLDDQIKNSYERNYSTHFTNIYFGEGTEIQIENAYIEPNNKEIVIEFDKYINSVSFAGGLIYFNDGKEIESVNKESQDKIKIVLKEELDLYEQIIGKTINFDNGSIELTNGEIASFINNSYEIKKPSVNIKNEDFENYTDTDELKNVWTKYDQGDIVLETKGSNNYIKKINNNDPNGGYFTFENVDDKIIYVSLDTQRPSGTSGGSQDRFSLVSRKGNSGKIEGYGSGITPNQFKIERRYNRGDAQTEIQTNYTRIEDEWINVFLAIDPIENKIYSRLKDSDGNIEILETTDANYNKFDSFFIHGGYEYYIDNIEIGYIE